MGSSAVSSDLQGHINLTYEGQATGSEVMIVQIPIYFHPVDCTPGRILQIGGSDKEVPW